MKKLLVIGIYIMLLSACSKTQQPETIDVQKDKPVAETDSVEVTPESASNVKVIKQNIKQHPFSDPASNDIFTVTLAGDSVLTADVTFEIKNSEGQLLHFETFKADFLLNYGVPENATKAQMEAFILNRIDTFFADDNFKSPAITADMTYDTNFGDKAIWDDIKGDKTAIGFYYLLGKEDGRWIAYSKSQKKVVLYFNCC
ncbi:hypothetical protein [Pontibacter fetidus]|uniref:Lipoprotein n=1 Tax=Pontibacter fetidus TaxID=2700082 RepID=A0A6B2H217_9BACT|nr:hypothetical protein [Pontibacter fetidus]NDK57309.1 hypothetical protein [Pontibacter fetidus]